MTTAQPPRRAWVAVENLDPALLTRQLSDLSLSPRVLTACDLLGLRSVADLLGVDEDTFLAVPGVGARSWQTLVAHVRRALLPMTTERDDLPAAPALAERFADPRARLALSRLGHPTLAVLQQGGRDGLLALPGATVDQVEAVLAMATDPSATPLDCWLPEPLASSRLQDLGLPANYVDVLHDTGVASLADLLAVAPATLRAHTDFGEGGMAAVRTALSRWLRRATGDVRHGGPYHRRVDGGLRRLLRTLEPDDRSFLQTHLGLTGRPPVPLQRLSLTLGISNHATAEREAQCRTNTHARAHVLLARWRRAASHELTAQEGAVRGERLARGALRAIAAALQDDTAPLRLLAFLFPRDLFLVGDVLTTVDNDTCRRAVQAIAEQRPHLPKPLAALEADLAAAGLPTMARGLLLHLVQHDAHLQVLIDPTLGEVVHRRRVTVGDRIEHLLRHARRALTMAELLFRYRDRYGCARRARLLDQLWAEPRFLEIGPGEWDLRERHVDQGELVEAEAARVRDTICTVGGRHEVADLIEGGASSERVLFLLRDRLRRDPALRNLGRGTFCARSLRSSTQTDALLRALRAAGGEVPLDRFLANQDKATRDLRTRLLRENRLFLAVAPDRIDALSNYPFNTERMRTLLRTVELHLEQHDGFDKSAGVLSAIADAGLGGDFLTAHLLRDLLVRHGRFELLADDLIALRSRGLKAWIQQRAREAIRRAARGLTAFEIQTEIPELAQFAACLERVVADDPMVQCRDGTHYVVI